MKSTYDLVRERIVSLIPEISHLTFGCRLRHFKEIKTICGYKGAGAYLLDDGSIWTYEMIVQQRYTEILGRQITLADVLRALRIVFEKTEGDAFDAHCKFGGVVLEMAWPLYTHKTTRVVREPMWNPRVPLSGQPEPLLLFLKGLLQVENI